MADPKKVRAEANAMVGELLERLAREEVRELEIKRGGLRVRVAKLDGAPERPASVAATTGGAPRATGGPAQATEAAAVNAPLTGIFYRSPSPQAQPYVLVGSTIGVGDVVGLIEAMKLFNEVRATVAGRVTRILIENGQLVRAHQTLLEVDPS